MKQPNHHVLPIWQKLLALACMWLAAALTAQAQTTGTIQGRVYNPGTQSYVRNAEVKLGDQTTYTESDGSFQFLNVPAGSASVTIQYTGYTTVTETFNVTAGQTAVREINITSTAAVPAPTTNKDGVVQLQAFTVASEREGNSKAIQAQRRDMNIITSVSSDLFGDVADGNVGEFLKYLPGVDLDYVESEPRGPRLGGMDGQYVGVSMDGMRTASADANRGGGAASRATSFEGFSITSVDSIEVNWTSSAMNDADTPAGNVNMRTKRAFNQKGRQVTYNFSANVNGEEFTLGKTDGPRDKQDRKWRPNYILTYSESFLNQRLGVLMSASHAYSYTEQITNTNTYTTGAVSAADSRPFVARVIDFKDGPKFIVKDAYLLTADYKVSNRLTLSLNMAYSYFEGEFWNRNFTFTAANDNTNVNNGRQRIRGDGITTVEVDPSTTSNVTQLSNGGGGAAKLSYTRQYSPKFEYRNGGLTVNGAMAFSRAVNNYESLERGFSKDSGGAIASGFIATRPNPSSWEWQIRQTSGPDWYNLANFTNTNTNTGGTRVTNDDRTWTTEKWTGNGDIRYVLPFMKRFPTVAYVGAKWDEETRKNHDHGAWSVWSYTGPGGNTVVYNANTETYNITGFGNWANMGPQFVSPNPFETGKSNALTIYNINGVKGMPPRFSLNEMSNLMALHPEQFVNTSTADNYYTSFIANERNFRQTIEAAYLQADTKLTSKLQLRYGVRRETTKNALNEFDPLTRAQMLRSPYASQFTATTTSRASSISGLNYQYMSQPRITRHSETTNYFPSVTLKYNILPNLEWQAGWNKSIGRAPIDNLTGLWVVDEQNQRVSAPNPNLTAERHQRTQTRVSYYTQGRSPGSFSLSLSQTKFTNTIASFDYTADQFGVDDPDYANYIFRSTTNLSDRVQTTRNLSASYRQTMGFLPSEYLRGITAFVNYDRTYVTQSGDGSGAAARRSGVAPHRVSGGISYRLRKFSAGLNFIWVDDRPDSTTYGRWWGAMTKWDGSLGYEFSRRLGIFVQARNITNQKDLWYITPPGYVEGDRRALRQMEEYGSNWVFGVKGTF